MKFARISEYERVETQLKEKLEAALRQRDELQATAESCQKRTVELLQSGACDRNKIEEACSVSRECNTGAGRGPSQRRGKCWYVLYSKA